MMEPEREEEQDKLQSLSERDLEGPEVEGDLEPSMHGRGEEAPAPPGLRPEEREEMRRSAGVRGGGDEGPSPILLKRLEAEAPEVPETAELGRSDPERVPEAQGLAYGPDESGRGGAALTSFAPDSAELQGAHWRAVREMVEGLISNLGPAEQFAEANFRFSGYASSDGSPAANQRLSQERAEAGQRALQRTWSEENLPENPSITSGEPEGKGAIEETPERRHSVRRAQIEYELGEGFGGPRDTSSDDRVNITIGEERLDETQRFGEEMGARSIARGPSGNAGGVALQGFAEGSAELEEAHWEGLRSMVRKIQSTETWLELDLDAYTFHFKGTASEEGRAEENQALSEARARAAKEGLQVVWAELMSTEHNSMDGAAIEGLGEQPAPEGERHVVRAAEVVYSVDAELAGGVVPKAIHSLGVETDALPEELRETYPVAAYLLETAGDIMSRAGAQPQACQPEPLAPHAHVLWQFWKASAGFADPQGRERVRPRERLDALVSAHDAAKPFVETLSGGLAGSEELLGLCYEQPYEMLKSDLGELAAMDAINSTVEAISDLEAGAEPENEEEEEDQIKAALLVGQNVFRTLLVAQNRATGGGMNKAITEAMRNVDATARDFGVERGPQATMQLLGIVNGMIALYSINNKSERQRAAAERGNIFSRIAQGGSEAVAVMGGFVALSTSLGAAIARVAGYTDEAAQLMALGAKSVRHIGQGLAILQLVYGVVVLFDPDSTGLDRIGAVASILTGALGAPGAAAALEKAGLAAKGLGGAVAGAATFAIAITAFQVDVMLRKYAEIRFSLSLGEVRSCMDTLNELAEPLRDVALRLGMALAAAEAEARSEVDQAFIEGFKAQVEALCERAKIRVLNFLRVVLGEPQGSTPLERWAHPANFPEIRDNFEGLTEQMRAASTPEEIVTTLHAVLAGVTEAFSEAEAIVRARLGQ